MRESVGDAENWAQRLAPSTHGWPRHITCYFRAAAEALLQTGRPVFDDENLARAAALAEANTRRYYDRRLEAARTNPLIVFAVHEATKYADTDADDAADVVDKAFATLSGNRQARHQANFPDALHCVNQMLYAGIVAYATTAPTSPLRVPIPSMATHVESLLNPAQRQQVRVAIGLPASLP